MNTPITINHIGSTVNYRGLEEGAEPVKVFRTAKFTVANVGEALREKFFNNDFRTIKFVDQSTGKLFIAPLLDAHYGRLAIDLIEGSTVEIVYETGTAWIKSLNGKRWN